MQISPEKLAAYQELQLQFGGHETFEQGHCAMEVVAWLAGESHTDYPRCTAHSIAELMQGWNDGFGSTTLDPETDIRRTQVLKPLLLETMGTRPQNFSEPLRRHRIHQHVLGTLLPLLLLELGEASLAEEFENHEVTWPDPVSDIYWLKQQLKKLPYAFHIPEGSRSTDTFLGETGIRAILTSWRDTLDYDDFSENDPDFHLHFSDGSLYQLLTSPERLAIRVASNPEARQRLAPTLTALHQALVRELCALKD